MGKESPLSYFNTDQPHLDAAKSNYTLKLTDKLVNKLSLKTGKSVLEVGSGEGRFTLPMLDYGLVITAVDLSPKLINSLSKTKHENLKVLLADIDQIESKVGEKFDCGVGFFVLHHLPNLDISLRSLRGILKKGAKIGFVEPNPWNPFYYLQPFVVKNMSWNEEKGFLKMTNSNLKRAFSNNGYKNFKIEKFGFFPPFVVNSNPGIKLDNFLEAVVLFKPFLPFQLITAETD